MSRLHPAWAAVRSTPAPLVALLATASVLTLAWGIAIAPFQGPDESDHFGYAQQLAETRHTPSASTGNGSVSSEENTALGYLNLLALRGIAQGREAWTPAEQAQYHRMVAALPPSARKDGNGPNPLGKNPPLYYAYEAIPYKVLSGSSLFTRLTFMRWASGALFVLAVLFAWLLAGEVFARRRWLQTLTAGVVALQPGYAAESGVVTADAGLACIWTAWLYVAVRMVRRGPSLSNVLALVGLCAASVLTHGRGLALVPATAVALGVVYLRHRPPLRLAAAWTAAAGALGLALVGAYRVFLTPPGAGGSLYGGEANVPGSSMNLRGFVAQVWDFYLPHLAFLPERLGPAYGFRQLYVDTFFSSFASLEVVLPTWVLDLAQVFVVVLVLAVYLACVARREAVRRSWDVALVLVTAGVCLVGFLHFASYRALVGVPSDPLIVGRYLFPGVALLGVAVAFVAWALPRRAGAVLAGAVLAAGVGMQLAGLGLTISRFYA
jgi:hypothetical protein